MNEEVRHAVHAVHLQRAFSVARTVRVRNGARTVSDGSAVQGEEFLTGYFLIETESFDAALEWAAKIPNAHSGSVEIRPVVADELADRMATASADVPG